MWVKLKEKCNPSSKYCGKITISHDWQEVDEDCKPLKRFIFENVVDISTEKPAATIKKIAEKVEAVAVVETSSPSLNPAQELENQLMAENAERRRGKPVK
jgi:hypothetical protein